MRPISSVSHLPLRLPHLRQQILRCQENNFSVCENSNLLLPLSSICVLASRNDIYANHHRFEYNWQSNIYFTNDQNFSSHEDSIQLHVLLCLLPHLSRALAEAVGATAEAIITNSVHHIHQGHHPLLHQLGADCDGVHLCGKSVLSLLLCLLSSSSSIFLSLFVS